MGDTWDKFVSKEVFYKMFANPYKQASASPANVWQDRSGNPIMETMRAMRKNQRSGSYQTSDTEHFWGAGNEINASSKRDLMAKIGVLIDQSVRGEIQRAVIPQDEATRNERYAMLVDAMRDPSGQAMQVVGEVVGDEVWETLGREGFSRQTLLYKPLDRAETGRIKIRRQDVVSFVVTSVPNVIASVVRQAWVYPPEFYLIANVYIEDKEIEQSGGDLLDDKYSDCMTQIFVGEDKIWKGLADQAASAMNDISFFTDLRPDVFSTIKTQVGRWNIPPAKCILAYDLWTDIISVPEFSGWFDPVSKHELVLEGKLGAIMDVEIITDAFRHETLKVLSPGELYIMGPPQTLGVITQRKELTTTSINAYNLGKPQRGWFFEQIEGMWMQSRAIAVGRRV